MAYEVGSDLKGAKEVLAKEIRRKDLVDAHENSVHIDRLWRDIDQMRDSVKTNVRLPAEAKKQFEAMVARLEKTQQWVDYSEGIAKWDVQHDPDLQPSKVQKQARIPAENVLRDIDAIGIELDAFKKIVKQADQEALYGP